MLASWRVRSRSINATIIRFRRGGVSPSARMALISRAANTGLEATNSSNSDSETDTGGVTRKRR